MAGFKLVVIDAAICDLDRSLPRNGSGTKKMPGRGKAATELIRIENSTRANYRRCGFARVASLFAGRRTNTFGSSTMKAVLQRRPSSALQML